MPGFTTAELTNCSFKRRRRCRHVDNFGGAARLFRHDAISRSVQEPKRCEFCLLFFVARQLLFPPKRRALRNTILGAAVLLIVCCDGTLARTVEVLTE